MSYCPICMKFHDTPECPPETMYIIAESQAFDPARTISGVPEQYRLRRNRASRELVLQGGYSYMNMEGIEWRDLPTEEE